MSSTRWAGDAVLDGMSPQGRRWHARAASWETVAWTTLAAFALATAAARWALTVGWHLPAPLGDGVLFASVAQYHCSSGFFGTPIYPIDPAGGHRYVWHGIGWPWLLSVLNPACSMAGGFLALGLVQLGTALVVAWGYGATLGPVRTIGLALVVFALQSKLGFRPETLAIAVWLIAHALRHRASPWIWTGVLSLLAWVQPTVFLIAIGHLVLSLDRTEWRGLARSVLPDLPLLAAVHALIAVAYPFPLSDLMQGLALQGQRFADRSDGDLFTYFVRSDFFPLFGVALGATLVLASWRRPAILLLLPALFYFGVRVPPAWYNLAPLFVVLLVGLQQRTARAPSRGGLEVGVLALCAGLALAGLGQSVARDSLSAWRDPASAAEVVAMAQQRQTGGEAVCEVPPWFTLWLPAADFVPNHVAHLRACEQSNRSRRVDLLPPVAMAQRSDSAGCLWPERREGSPASLDRLFRSGSGYGVVVCPTASGATREGPFSGPGQSSEVERL